MPWFFTNEELEDDSCLIIGEDSRHIEKSLRMRIGEELTLVSPEQVESLCEITEFTQEGVRVCVKAQKPCENEPKVNVTLYQSLTKGDKMDFIVQKAVELGVHRIVPVLSARCISRPEEKQMKKKIERWQKIASGAASQSCRGKIPQVEDMLAFPKALEDAKDKKAIIFYEGGGEKLSSLVSTDTGGDIGIFIGSEGGFEPLEVEQAKARGVVPATLGKRILRAETAPLAALSSIMLLTGNFD
ncbi:MAG: 16S rRNA (uracil(1498)-N(3))-methyltransferase [Eubacteriales bacterium]|nr:16S rRNA (uracil(1498)-N(3))-methyltransferase [Eubacteriales bacterium]